VLIFISENPLKDYHRTNNENNEFHKNFNIHKNNRNNQSVNSIKEILVKIKNAFKNKNLIGFLGILLFSRVGLIFYLQISSLILIDKGYHRENLTNLKTIMMFIEIIISFKLSDIKKDFLKHYINSYKILFLILSFEIMILMAYEFYREIIDQYPLIFFGIQLAQNIIRSYSFMSCIISVSGFFHKIADRTMGATYITALNSINNLSKKWPGLLIFLLVDYFNYKIIGLLSILYSIGFYMLFKKKLLEYDDIHESEWASIEGENDVKFE